jgi:hypothetical protein
MRLTCYIESDSVYVGICCEIYTLEGSNYSRDEMILKAGVDSGQLTSINLWEKVKVKVL